LGGRIGRICVLHRRVTIARCRIGWQRR
jgi:hypothetical protein